MTEPAGSPEAARMDELAAVTAEYAKYSRTAYGLGFVVLGAVVIAAAALDVIARTSWARVAYLLLPAVWLLVIARARAHYQRHGTVVEPGQGIRRRHVRGRRRPDTRGRRDPR